MDQLEALEQAALDAAWETRQTGDIIPMWLFFSATGASVRVISGPQYGFDHPDGIAVIGPDLFVSDGGSAVTGFSGTTDKASAVTELNASTGALVRVLSGPGYDFAYPEAMAVGGGDLFVASVGDINGDGSAVTEVNAWTGVPVRVFAGSEYKLDQPDALAVFGPDLLIAVPYGANGGHVTELTTSTGSLVRVISGPQFGFDHADALAVKDPDLFVANGGMDYDPNGAGSITEVNGSTGALVRVLKDPHYDFDDPEALTLSGADLYVVNGGNNAYDTGSVTEVVASTGPLVRVVSGSPYRFDDPDVIAPAGPDLFVANSNGGSVTEFPG